MKIYIFSFVENLGFCNQLCTHLRSLDHECTVFESISKFMTQVDEHADQPDLYVLDFFLYNHYVFNAYTYLKENDCSVPLIFFNDPQKKTGSDSYYWKNMLELLYTSEKFNWTKYETVINQVTRSCAEIRSSAKSEAAVSVSYNDSAKETASLPATLSSSEIIIYRMLLENPNKSISIQDFQMAIKKTSKICRESTIACIMSSLRKKLASAGIRTSQIIKNGTGYKLISL